MTTTLADAFVRLRLDQTVAKKELKEDLPKAAGDTGKQAGSSFGSTFAKAAGGLLAASAVVSFFHGVLDEALESQKVGAQTTAVLKSTGGAAGITAGQIGNLATSISNKIGVDDEAIQSNENLLLTFTNVRNEVGKGNDIFNQATQTISDMSAALGQDGKSSAIQLGKALNDPIKGITALSRVGVSFTDQQKKAITADVKRGDTLKAQKIILAELTKEFGGSAAAVATPGEKMKVAWSNLQETIGLAVLPILGKLETFVTTLIPKALAVGTALADWAKHSTMVHDAIAILVVVVQALWTGIVAVAGYIGDHQTVFKALAVGILAIAAAMTIWNVITKIVAVSEAVLNAVLALNPIGAIILLIVGLVAAFIYLWNHSAAFRDFWEGLWKDIQGAAEAVGHWFTNSLPHAFGVAMDAIGKVLSGFEKLLDKWLVNPYLSLISFILNGAAKAFGWVPGLGGKLKDAAKKFDDFKDAVNRSLNGIKNYSRTVKVTVTGNGANLVANGQIVGHLAAGGTVTKSGRYLVGEEGPEIAELPAGTTVYPHGTAPATAATGGGNTFNIYDSSVSAYELANELAWAAKAKG